ncbi:hypothetical protein Q8A50_06345 [Leuconostoc mesenteroides]|uniref:hypothetical protein n=1 Tax=Leuconostoc mesenteroides TaxID=1245 RepID=UPI002730763A|nr:hypothetical protein [Leuconostoc mesenteroides]MDP0487182.1 hypothetical protein [Leuconostoc mesenteroides]
MSDLRISTNCPFCNGINTVKEINPQNAGETFVLHSVPTTGNVTLPEGGIMVNAVICNQCKHIQLFAPNYHG